MTKRRVPTFDPNLSLEGINEKLRSRSIGPIERFVLFASGAPIRLLQLVPVERTEFLIQGTGVLLAASLSYVSAFIAAGLIIDPMPTLAIRAIIAAVVAALIFTVDRTLVRSTLRPYHFPDDVLRSLWDPAADAKWYTVLAGSVRQSGPIRNTRAFFGVIAKASLRFLLAILVSYLVADLIVIDAFRPTIDARATQILTTQKHQAEAAAVATYKSTVAAAQALIANATSTIGANQDVKSATNERDRDRTLVSNAATDVDKLTKYEQAERQGVAHVRVTLSDGVTYPANPKGTTGVPGCARECHDAVHRLEEEQATLRSLRSQLKAAETALTHALAAAGGSAAVTIGQAHDQIRTARRTELTNLRVARHMKTTPDGLLIRREALHQLEQDPTPWDLNYTPTQPCSSSFHWLCELRQSVFPSTPLGSYVSVFRGILFLIDILPILLKIFYSLRGRRAFDVLMAALEEASVADSINKLDFTLNDYGADMEERAATRRGRRTGSGARLLREAQATTRRQRKQLEQSIRRQLEAEYDPEWLNKKLGRKQWFRARRAFAIRFRRPNQVVVVDAQTSPWRERRVFDPPPPPSEFRDLESSDEDPDESPAGSGRG